MHGYLSIFLRVCARVIKVVDFKPLAERRWFFLDAVHALNNARNET
jgi:hypothetical protein